MIIINADDFGRSQAETDVILECYERRRITSATAMVFMKDSERAATLARKADLDVGLHLNLSERFTGADVPRQLRDDHELVVRFLLAHKSRAPSIQPLTEEAVCLGIPSRAPRVHPALRPAALAHRRPSSQAPVSEHPARGRNPSRRDDPSRLFILASRKKSAGAGLSLVHRPLPGTQVPSSLATSSACANAWKPAGCPASSGSPARSTSSS